MLAITSVAFGTFGLSSILRFLLFLTACALVELSHDYALLSRPNNRSSRLAYCPNRDDSKYPQSTNWLKFGCRFLNSSTRWLYSAKSFTDSQPGTTSEHISTSGSAASVSPSGRWIGWRDVVTVTETLL